MLIFNWPLIHVESFSIFHTILHSILHSSIQVLHASFHSSFQYSGITCLLTRPYTPCRKPSTQSKTGLPISFNILMRGLFQKVPHIEDRCPTCQTNRLWMYTSFDAILFPKLIALNDMTQWRSTRLISKSKVFNVTVSFEISLMVLEFLN